MIPRRRNYFIKKKFQMNFLYRFLMLLILESALIAGLFLYVSNNTLTTGYFDSILRIERTPIFFFVPFLLIILTVVIGMTMIGMIVFILLTHRIAGPLYRFEKDLEEIASGNLSKRINLRKTDQMTELQEALNSFVDTFDQKIGRVKDSVFELRELLSKKDDPEAAKKIYEMVEYLKGEIDQFKVSSGSKE